MTENEIGTIIIDMAIMVHRELSGPGVGDVDNGRGWGRAGKRSSVAG